MTPKIANAPLTAKGFYEARPSDVSGRDDFYLLDVRETPELTSELGHIHGVHHVPMSNVMHGAVAHLDKETPIVCICKSGGRSAMTASALLAQGFKEVYNLVGGMTRWNAEGHPVAKTQTWK